MRYWIIFTVLISLSVTIFVGGINYERLKHTAALAESQRIAIERFDARQLVFSAQSERDAALFTAEQSKSEGLQRQLRAKRVVQTCTQLDDTSEPLVIITDGVVGVLSELTAAIGLPKDEHNSGYADPDAPVTATTLTEYLGYTITTYNSCALNYNSLRAKIKIADQ